ncbi:hypothetical protein ACM66B_005510 [Microbotryomycetes sp. NB124-2]
MSTASPSRGHAHIPAILALVGAVYAVVLACCMSAAPSVVRDARIANAKRILWVVAHPDDESFFFGPSLTNLLHNNGTHGSLISMSTGDFEGQGSIRSGELVRSCAHFGIAPADCTAHDDS